MRTHGNEVSDAAMIVRALGDHAGPERNFFCGLPLFHVNAAMVTGLVPWLAGSHVVLGPAGGYREKAVLANFFEIVEAHRINVFSGVPTLFGTLLQQPVGDHDLRSLDFAVCGAAPMPVELFKRFEAATGIRILEGYGLTESACVASLNPIDGDRIYIFGFSRGAYTARVLAAMLYKVGLLGKGNEELIPFAWDIFKRKYGDDIYKGFRHTYGRKVEVAFLGLWDTVSSVGWIWNPLHFQFTKDNPIVRIVRHAMALDERRAYFWQNLWTTKTKEGLDAVQVWFPGVHCDVGGGYVEVDAGLSKIALEWMVREAERVDVVFNAQAKAAIMPSQSTKEYAAASPLAKKHESLRGLWWIPEFVPKRFRDPTKGFEQRWIIPLGRFRTLESRALIHKSVFARKRSDATYAPTNIPEDYREVA
jgi:hypothetical protein